MNSKISAIVDYISLLVKKYTDIQQSQMQNTFRLASIKKTTKGIRIIFQVIGKATFMECTPAEILSNESFMERFSKKDIQKITYAYADEQNKISNFKLIQQEFNQKAGKTQITLLDKEGKSSLKTAAEIAADKNLITKLTQQDALNIGYIAGFEHSQNDSNH